MTQTSTQAVPSVSLPANKRHGSVALDVLRSMKKSRPVSTFGKSVIINLESNAREAGNILSTKDKCYSEKILFELIKKRSRKVRIVQGERVLKREEEAEMFELEKEKLKAQTKN